MRDVDKLAMQQRIVQLNVSSAKNLSTSFMVALSVNGLIHSASQKALQSGVRCVKHGHSIENCPKTCNEDNGESRSKQYSPSFKCPRHI